MNKFIVLLGPPGAGKGTQAKMVSEKLGVPHISTGDILREAVRKDSPVGREAKAVMEKGGLVSDGLLAEIVKERLSEEDCVSGFILDGYPRNIPQSETLEAVSTAKGTWKKIVALEIEVPDENIIDRLKNRRSCPKCGMVYNLKTSPPKKDEMCDSCSTRLVQREDDGEKTIRQRLIVYHEKTAPVTSYFGARNKHLTVEGEGSPEEVFDNIMEKLK